MLEERIQFHHAIDRRCYHGAYSSDLQREVDSHDKALDHLASLGMSAPYFPAEQAYIGFSKVGKHKIITGECSSLYECYHKCMDWYEENQS